MLSQKHEKALIARHQALMAKLDKLKKRAQDEAKKTAKSITAKARAMAGPHGVILDAQTYEPLRAATKTEVAASVAAAPAHDPVGPITIDGREVFALPSSMLAD